MSLQPTYTTPLTAFHELETPLHLGGRYSRTPYFHINLTKTPFGWVLESILKSH